MHMSPRYIGLDPNQVVWSNLRIQWWERVIRNGATITFVVALVIFWAIPVAAVGAISNINFLIQKVPFLKFIDSIPTVILGVITGLLPSVLLAVLMALLPIVLRCKFSLGTGGELQVDRFSFRDGKAWWRTDNRGDRTQDTKFLLRFPGCPSLPCNNRCLFSVECGGKNPGSTVVRPTVAGQQSPQGVKLLLLLYNFAGPDICFRRPSSDCWFDCGQATWHVPRQFTTKDVYPLGNSLWFGMGDHSAAYVVIGSDW